MSSDDLCVRAEAARLVLEGKAEEAVEMLSRYYGIRSPRLRVGLPRGCKRALGCYDARHRVIYVRSREEYFNPYVVLHEFYHHLRSFLGRHRGTEDRADRYAAEAVEALLRGLTACVSGEQEGGHGEWRHRH